MNEINDTANTEAATNGTIANETVTSGMLIAHCGTSKITRQELLEIPAPEGTRTHQPLAHHKVVEVLEEALSFRYLKIIREEYAVSQDGMKMFGVMDLSLEFSGCRFSIGLRNSNDKSMRLALTAGYRVFVCDNMAFSGDFTPLLHKHSRRLELADAISVAVDRIQRGFAPLCQQVQAMKDRALSEEESKLIIYSAFLDRSIRGVPRHLMPIVHDLYFKPEHEAFVPRNLWSLSNAFTSAFKKLAPVKQFEATARLGTYLSDAQEELSRKGELVLQLPSKRRLIPDDNDDDRRDFGFENFDEDDIPEDPFSDENFDDYFDEETANEAIIDAIEEMEHHPFPPTILRKAA